LIAWRLIGHQQFEHRFARFAPAGNRSVPSFPPGVSSGMKPPTNHRSQPGRNGNCHRVDNHSNPCNKDAGWICRGALPPAKSFHRVMP
jgi:hypothetical protein